MSHIDSPAGGVPASPLKIHRLARNLRQTDAAEQAGISPRTLGRLERGESRPHRKTAIALAHVLGVPIESIFFPNDKRRPGQDAAVKTSAGQGRDEQP